MNSYQGNSIGPKQKKEKKIKRCLKLKFSFYIAGPETVQQCNIMHFIRVIYVEIVLLSSHFCVSKFDWVNSAVIILGIFFVVSIVSKKVKIKQEIFPHLGYDSIFIKIGAVTKKIVFFRLISFTQFEFFPFFGVREMPLES